MIALLLCALVAGAAAAPQFDFDDMFEQRPRPYFSNYHLRSHPYVNENVFDTGRFWSDLSKELRDLDTMLADFSRRFPASVTTSQGGIVGNEYKITIGLSGFEEKDIVVKARDGLVMIQANHKFGEGSERNYLDVRTLPDSVNVTGNWVFEGETLKITFPLKEGTIVPTEPTTTEQRGFETTVGPSFAGSREEIETNVNEGVQVQDVDVGIGRGDQDKEQDLKTNEIPDRNAVEATTYAVDLKDEVEFVPVRY
uniref:SHSP domain-containing protein n=1 Tax=Heliothis virescens TaxID=7102 RepID=A0A2A4K8A8_HELVI